MLKKWEMVEEAWVEAEKSIQSGQWDLVVLDDINYAISDGMLDRGEGGRRPHDETGNGACYLNGSQCAPTIVDIPDMVTQMRPLKHSFEKGGMAQRGTGILRTVYRDKT